MVAKVSANPTQLNNGRLGRENQGNAPDARAPDRVGVHVTCVTAGCAFGGHEIS